MGSFCRSSPQTTTQQQTQTYTPAPQIMGAGTQALTAAQQAAGQPFQMPVAPVAGFSPLQQQYFSGVSGMQGMAQPYFNMGQGYLQGSAAPITGADVSQYYNPMAANITAQMENIFGQQMRQMTGSATQQAGGAGADRIAVAQAELANQQGLAAGQTYAGLYQQALQAAEQQKQMMAGAGYGIAQMGPAAQAAQLQGLGALGAAGGQQQQLSQAQMNALYQQQLAQIAYPFQTAQYLAGITGALAPGMGGITSGTGTGTLTPAQPSPFAQILGGATAGAGLLTGLGGLTGGGTSAGTIGGTGLAGSGGLYDRGGKVIDLDASEYQEGGGAFDPTEQAGPQGQNRFSMLEETMPNMSVMGTPMPSGRPMSIKAEPIPTTPLMRDPRLPSQVGAMQMNMPQQQQQQSGGSGFGDVLKLAANVIPFFLKRGGKIELDAMGGAVGPMDVGRGFATDDEIDMTGDPPLDVTNMGLGQTTAADRQADDNALRLAGRDPGSTVATPPMGVPPPARGMEPGDITIPPAHMLAQYHTPQQQVPMGANADLNVGTFTMPQSQLPYPDATKRDWGQDLTRSPWMSLVAAGARMMQTPGPIGSVIGAGLGAGAQELGAQRKALQSEADINIKAQQLYQQAQEHLLEFTRVKPDTAARIEAEAPLRKAQIENLQSEVSYRGIEAQKPVLIRQDMDMYGRTHAIYGVRQPDGSFIDPSSGEKVKPPSAADDGSGVQQLINTPRPENLKQGDFDYDYLNKLREVNPALASDTERVASGQGKFPTISGGRGPGAAYGLMLRDSLNRFGQVDETNFGQRQKTANDWAPNGKSGQTITSFNYAGRHTADLGELTKGLNPSQIRVINATKNWIKTQFSDPQLEKWRTQALIVATEVPKNLRGAGVLNEQEEQRWNDRLMGSPSVEAYLGGLGQLGHSMNVRNQELFSQYKGIMHKDPPYTLSPEAQKAFAQMERWRNGDFSSGPAVPQGSVPGTKGGAKVWKTPDGQYIPRE